MRSMPASNTVKPSSRRCRSRYSRESGSRSASRTAFVPIAGDARRHRTRRARCPLRPLRADSPTHVLAGHGPSCRRAVERAPLKHRGCMDPPPPSSRSRSPHGSRGHRSPSRAPRSPLRRCRVGSSSSAASSPAAANSRRVDAYDPGADSWSRLPDLPVSVDHAAAASWRGRLVVVGGYGADRAPLRAAFLFDGRSWRRLPAPPEERGAAAAAATADGRVWVVGGRTRTGLAARALSLDLRTLRWRVVPGPTPREHLAATALAGRVYVLAGRLAGLDTNLGTVEAYDPKTNRWSKLPRPAGSARGNRSRSRRRQDRLRRRRVTGRDELECLGATAGRTLAEASRPPHAPARPRRGCPAGSGVGDRRRPANRASP